MLRLNPLPLALLATLAPAAVFAFDPMPLSNTAALAQFAALPDLGRASVLDAGATTLRLNLDLANEYAVDGNGLTTLELDGESQAWTLGARRGFGGRFEVGVEATLLHRSGGFLDGTIENWHEWFGLPDGGRPDAPRDRLRYRLIDNGVVRMDVDDDWTGVSDLRLSGGWQATEGAALRAMLALPTGDADALAGGHWGAASWLDLALPAPFGDRVEGSLSGGVAWQETTGPLADLQRDLTPFAGLALGWHFWRGATLLGQLYWHDALYDDPEGVELDAFRPGLQGSLGLRWETPSGWRWDLGFQEDLITDASSDFAIHAGLSWMHAGR